MDELYADIGAKAMPVIEIAIISDMPVGIIIGATIVDAAREKNMRRVLDPVTEVRVVGISRRNALQILECYPSIKFVRSVIKEHGRIMEPIFQPVHPIQPGTMVGKGSIP